MPNQPASQPVVMITGAGAGIGLATARRFASAGYRLGLFDMDAARLANAQADFAAAGTETIAIAGNAGREADLQSCAQQLIQKFGRIDALVANAGARVYGSILDATDADWDTIIAVNLKGVALACKAVIPTMQKQKRGAIVLISSLNAVAPRAGMPLYDATKAGVISLMGSLAIAHGRDGIRINTVCPGFTITDFHIASAAGKGQTEADIWKANEGYGLLGRPCKPSEIAAGIYFLASDEASQITGQTLCIDSGQGLARK